MLRSGDWHVIFVYGGEPAISAGVGGIASSPGPACLPSPESRAPVTVNSDSDKDRSTPLAIVDGSNVAHSTEGESGRIENILLVRDKLLEEGYEPIVVADAALRHQIDDGDTYERMVEEGTIRQAPAGTDADYFILAFARELEAKAIVSNDRFRDRMGDFPEARDHLVRYMIVAGEVVFERRTRKRTKKG